MIVQISTLQIFFLPFVKSPFISQPSLAALISLSTVSSVFPILKNYVAIVTIKLPRNNSCVSKHFLIEHLILASEKLWNSRDECSYHIWTYLAKVLLNDLLMII